MMEQKLVFTTYGSDNIGSASSPEVGVGVSSVIASYSVDSSEVCSNNVVDADGKLRQARHWLNVIEIDRER